MKSIKIILPVFLTCILAGCSAVESTGDAVVAVGEGTGNAISGVGSAIGSGVNTIVSGTGEAITDGARKTNRKGY